jgi:hypothetical protein
MAMKKHVALTLLALTTLGVLNAHIDLPEVDGRRFVKAQEKLHDPLGWAEDLWAAGTTSCAPVQRLDEYAALARAGLQAIQAFSPPDSASARVLQMQEQAGWLLAEVEFQSLSPAVVLLKSQAHQVLVVDGAVWSGSTWPWRPAPLIRRHLRERAPASPMALLECFTPRSALFLPP